MKALAHLLLFNALYSVAVLGAARGHPWAGALALAPFVAGHLMLTPEPLRRRALGFLAGVGLAGTAMDSGLLLLGLTGYAGTPEGWPAFLVPPWISALWIAFAALAGSLRWLQGRPWLACAFGGLGGPLSFWCGGRLGAVTLPAGGATLAALALQYAVVLPLLVRWTPRAPRALPRGREAIRAARP